MWNLFQPEDHILGGLMSAADGAKVVRTTNVNFTFVCKAIFTHALKEGAVPEGRLLQSPTAASERQS